MYSLRGNKVTFVAFVWLFSHLCMHDPCSGFWSSSRVCHHEHPQTIAHGMIALFVLIRISPAHRTSSYSDCTSSSSICSMIEASPLPGALLGKVNHLQEVVTGVVLLHLVPLHHHLTLVWRCTWDGFAHAGPPWTWCDNCGHPFLNSKHLCVDDDDENDNQNSKCESARGPEEDILDYKACHDVVANNFFSPDDKHKILERNCISLLKIEPINFELAKYCFTRSKFFHLRKNDHTLGLSTQKLVNIFDREFEDAYKTHYNWVDMLVCALRAWSGIIFRNH